MKIPGRCRGFSLIEAMFSVVLVALVGLIVITIMMQTTRTHQFERERVLAVAEASREIEADKRKLFPSVRPKSEVYLLDVHNTPSDTTDDLIANKVVTLKDRAGNTITAPVGNDAIRLIVTISWTSMGKSHSQTLSTILTP